ncbi:MAG: NYN domain-containing protein [Halothece sp.]
MTLKSSSNQAFPSQILEGTALTASVIGLILEQGMLFAIAPLWATIGFGMVNRKQLHSKLKEKLEQQNTEIENLQQFDPEKVTTETTEIKELIEKLETRLVNPTPETAGAKTTAHSQTSQRGLVSIFVDHTSLQRVGKSLKFRIDYEALLTHLQQNSPLDAAWFYTKINKNNSNFKKFYQTLETYGYQVKERRLQQEVDQEMPQNQLAFDLEDLASDCETVVLVSSNHEFTPLVQKLQQDGKRVEIVGSRNDKNEDLIAIADEFISLEEIKPQIESSSNCRSN